MFWNRIGISFFTSEKNHNLSESANFDPVRLISIPNEWYWVDLINHISEIQMGSHMKKSIFDEQTSKALKKWHMAVKKKHGGRAGGKSPTRTLGAGGSPTSSMGSPFHPTAATLHRFKTTGHSGRLYDDHDVSDLEDPSTPPPPTASLITRSEFDLDDHHADMADHVDLEHSGEETRHEDDFSFVKPAIQQK